MTRRGYYVGFNAQRVGDSILIGSDIKIQVVKVKGCQVRLGIEAPKETKVFREEVLAKKPPQERSASESPFFFDGAPPARFCSKASRFPPRFNGSVTKCAPILGGAFLFR